MQEVDRSDPDAGKLVESRSVVYKLTGLFALDSFAGGFIVQSFIVFWFQRKFGAGTPLLGAVIAVTGVVQAFSFLAATRLAARIGLLNTMVFTHLPSNIMLMILPFISNLWVAIAVFIIRFPLSQMDIPTRQGYLAELTPPKERAAAGGSHQCREDFGATARRSAGRTRCRCQRCGRLAVHHRGRDEVDLRHHPVRMVPQGSDRRGPQGFTERLDLDQSSPGTRSKCLRLRVASGSPYLRQATRDHLVRRSDRFAECAQRPTHSPCEDGRLEVEGDRASPNVGA